MGLEKDFVQPSVSSRPSPAFFCHLSVCEESKQEIIINSNYCLINTEISAACSACRPQLDAISKFGQLAWAAVFHLWKTDRHLRDPQAEEGAGLLLKDLPGSLRAQHLVQNGGKRKSCV